MRRFLPLAACLAVFPSLSPPVARAAEPVRLIFDTDICGDCDDVLALGMIHSLESRGACKLLAVTISVDNDLAAPFVDAVNTFYGRGDIPIGVVRKGGAVEQSKYLALVNEKDPQGKDRYPHDLRSGKDAPSAVSVLRKALAAQPDASVVIAQVGFSTNLADLLQSGPDDASPLGGSNLVVRKVKFISVMAGAFRPIEGNASYVEYNVIKDLPNFQRLVTYCPMPIVFSGFEIGIALPYPAISIERDYGYVAHHPLAEAYIRYIPPPHERPTWDLTSVLYAVLADRGYFELSPVGRVTVRGPDEKDDPRPPGAVKFELDAEGNHRYLILKPEQRERVREALVQLSSQPPSPSPGARP